MTKRTLMFVLFVAILIVSASTALAQNSAQVYLKPVSNTGNSVTIEVMADNVTDLYGVEFSLRFDPAAVSVADANPNQPGVQVEAGRLLPPDQGFVVINQADTDQGIIAFAMTLLNPAPAVSGSGSLARITFDLKQSASSTVEIQEVKLVSVGLQTIPVETTNLTLGSSAVESAGFPWWIVALGIIVVGLVGLGAFILVAGNLRGPQKTRRGAQRP